MIVADFRLFLQKYRSPLKIHIMKRILLSSVLFLAGYIGCMAAHDYIPYIADGKEW